MRGSGDPTKSTISLELDSFLQLGRNPSEKKIKHTGGRGGMGPWAFGVPLILVSTLGLLLNGYILLVVLGLNKQVND